jgi:integrase
MLRITPSEVKSWSVVYKFNGRMRRFTLGVYPAVKLADARIRAKNTLSDVSRGHDPQDAKIAARAAGTFGEMSDAYMERWAKKRKKSWKEDERIIATYLSKFKNVRPQDIRRADIRVLIEGIAEKAPIQANRVLACVRKIFNWAISTDLAEFNPCDHLPAPGKEMRRDRVLSEVELQAVWKATDHEDHLMAALYKLRMLTAQRGAEVAGLRWNELEIKDSPGESWWTIPKERSKNKMPHRVPLSEAAVRLLQTLSEKQGKLKNVTKRTSPFVFYAPRGKGHIVELQKAAQRIRETARVALELEEFDFTPHDLRRSAASYITSMGIPRLVVGRILNHAEPGVTAVYDRHSYDGEKRDALDRWSKKLLTMVSGLKVMGAGR